jgi:hypothetical protein
MAELDWLNNGVHRTLNLCDALLMIAGECCRGRDSEISASRSSSGTGFATWKSLPSHSRSNGENLLTRMADIPWAWATWAPGYSPVLAIICAVSMPFSLWLVEAYLV